MESKKKRPNSKKRGSINNVPKGVLNMIFDRVGYDDNSIVSAQSVCKKWKTILEGSCTNSACPLSRLFSGALLNGNKISIVHLLKHNCVSKQAKMELLCASESLKLHKIVNIKNFESMRDILLTRACAKGQGEIVKVLLDKGASISSETLLNACKCIQYNQLDESLRAILTYTGRETEEAVKLGLLEGLKDTIARDCDTIEGISILKDINNHHSKDNETNLLAPIDNDRNNESHTCDWKGVADTLDEVLKSQRLSLSMRNLALTRAFIYLFKWESRFDTFYNYVQAYSTAIETRDFEFCFMLYQQNPQILGVIPMHCIQHFVILDWSDMIELSIRHYPERVTAIVEFSIQNNSANSFRVAFNLALEQLLAEDTIMTKELVNEFLNTTTLSVIEQSSDKMLFSLLENEYVMQKIGKDEHIFLVHESLRRSLYTSLELLLELASTKESVYKILVLADFADLIVKNLLKKNEYEVISKLLTISYVKISPANVFTISMIIRDKYNDDDEDLVEIGHLKGIMEQRIDLFEFIKM